MRKFDLSEIQRNQKMCIVCQFSAQCGRAGLPHGIGKTFDRQRQSSGLNAPQASASLMMQLDVATRSTGHSKNQMSPIHTLNPSSTAHVQCSAHLLLPSRVNI